ATKKFPAGRSAFGDRPYRAALAEFYGRQGEKNLRRSAGRLCRVSASVATTSRGRRYRLHAGLEGHRKTRRGSWRLSGGVGRRRVRGIPDGRFYPPRGGDRATFAARAWYPGS